MLNLSATTSVRFTSTASYVSKALAFTSPFPAQFGAGSALSGSQIQVFALLSQ